MAVPAHQLAWFRHAEPEERTSSASLLLPQLKDVQNWDEGSCHCRNAALRLHFGLYVVSACCGTRKRQKSFGPIKPHLSKYLSVKCQEADLLLGISLLNQVGGRHPSDGLRTKTSSLQSKQHPNPAPQNMCSSKFLMPFSSNLLILFQKGWAS